jgi:hypothetical protein
MTTTFSFRVMTPEESKASNDHDPYCIIDGKWGGFGPTLWFVHRHIHPTNVFERSNKEWVRVWDTGAKRWRDITTEERALLPPIEELVRPIRTDIKDVGVITFPIIQKCAPESILLELVSIQPMVSS